MKKSKFLKKSLAMLLAVMLVVAMIPLSAAAAYEPAYDVTPVSLSGGDLEGSAPTWSIEFPYDANDALPEMTVQLGNSQDTVTVIKADGSETALPAAGISLERDQDNNPVPFRFYVTNAKNEKSETYTVNWTMAAPATSGVATKATLDNKYEGRISGSDITFTVPFGYTGTKAYTVKFEGCAQDEISDTFSGTVGTNMHEAKAEVIKNTTEDNKTDLSYNVYVVEETGLESITIGDYEGKFEIEDEENSVADKGYETGEITFTIPADLEADDNDELNLIPVLEVGSNYSAATLDGETLVSGKEFNFVDMLEGTPSDLVLTSTTVAGEDEDISYTRYYSLQFVREGSDTTIDAFTANGETGTVNGTNLTATISKNDSLNAVDLAFEGPITYTGAASGTPSIEVVGQDGKTATFDTEGKSTVIADVNCTNPVRLLVKAADGETQVYYNLTVTQAEEENNNPQITSAKMTITDENGEEKEYTASISGLTITFTVPYSTLDADVKGAEYTLAKTALTTTNEDTAKASFTVKDGGKITATSTDNDNEQVYTVKFTKEAAKTGKAISDFVLTDAENINEVGYNNNVDYDVTVSGSELKVSVPQGTDVDALFANFTLSEGAKLYNITSGELGDEVKADFDKKTGDAASAVAQFDKDKKYLVVDETLAYAIATSDEKADSYTKIKNNFAGHYTEYTFKVTETAKSDAARLTAISADDKAVTATIGGANANEITLTVPYGYATRGTAFFFDFTVSAGAKLSVDGTDLISGGEQNWDSDKEKLVEAGNSATNPAFHVAKDTDGKYYLYDADGQKVTTLTVTAQNGTATKEYTIKGDVKTKDANTGALLTSVKVNNTSATINNTAKTVTVSLPFGTNLGQVTLDITASTMAAVSFPNYDPKNPDKTYDIRNGLKITVTSENGATTNVYTLTATTAAQFSDVNTGDWYYDNVMDAVAAGIVSGRGDGTFGPNDRITRRDFAIMVSKLLLDGEDAPEATTTPFSDVAANDYGLNAIAYCAENGIISGFDGEFRPSDNITRQEAASVMKNALELTGTTSELFADDAAIATWAKANVYACKAAGVFNGDDHNNFNPTSTLTRAEAASIMVNAMK